MITARRKTLFQWSGFVQVLEIFVLPLYESTFKAPTKTTNTFDVVHTAAHMYSVVNPQLTVLQFNQLPSVCKAKIQINYLLKVKDKIKNFLSAHPLLCICDISC